MIIITTAYTPRRVVDPSSVYNFWQESNFVSDSIVFVYIIRAYVTRSRGMSLSHHFEYYTRSVRYTRAFIIIHNVTHNACTYAGRIRARIICFEITIIPWRTIILIKYHAFQEKKKKKGILLYCIKKICVCEVNTQLYRSRDTFVYGTYHYYITAAFAAFVHTYTYIYIYICICSVHSCWSNGIIMSNDKLIRVTENMYVYVQRVKYEMGN